MSKKLWNLDVEADVVIWSIRAFYIFAAYVIIIITFIPDLNSRFLDYGARSSSSTHRNVRSSLPRWLTIQIDPVLDWLSTFSVPHSWFSHFYMCSTICSAICLTIWTPKLLLQQTRAEMPLMILASEQGRAILALVLLQVQGLRRLYECLFIAKASSSRMWIGHYGMGLAFYLATNIAVWIEPVLMPSAGYSIHTNVQFLSETTVFNLLRILLSVGLFLQSSYQQHIVHKYLASLKEYKVPDHPLFESTNTVCPHYGAEVNIYLALAILTARSTRIFNLTLVCALGFVAINLGVTADLTKTWQLSKFSKQRVQIAGRRRMLALW